MTQIINVLKNLQNLFGVYTKNPIADGMPKQIPNDVNNVINHYKSMINELTTSNYQFLILAEFHGVMGYQLRHKLRMRPNFSNFEAEINELQNPDEGVYAMIYSSSPYNSLKRVIDSSDFDGVFSIPYFFDQIFCLFNELNWANLEPIYDDDVDSDGIKRYLNNFLRSQHNNIIIGLETNNIDLICISIRLIFLIQERFMLKASKDLSLIRNFVNACSRLYHNNTDNNKSGTSTTARKDLDVVLIDHESPDNRADHVFKVQNYNLDTMRTFDIEEDDETLLNIFVAIRNRSSLNF